MKKLLLLFMLITSIASAQIRLSQPISGQIQAIGIRNTESRLSTVSYSVSSIYFSIDTIYNNSVSIYLNGSLSSIYSGSSAVFYLNNIVATTPQSVATQLRAWGVAQATSGGGGGGGSSNPYPGSDYSKNAPLTSIDGKTPLLNGDGGSPVHVANFPATQPISATALPLPTSAATSTNQTSQITAEQAIQSSVASIDNKTTSAVSTSAPFTVSLTTTASTLAGHSCKYFEIINNRVGAVDLQYNLIGGTDIVIVPAGSVKRVINTNTNLYQLAASAGAPSVTIEYAN